MRLPARIAAMIVASAPAMAAEQDFPLIYLDALERGDTAFAVEIERTTIFHLADLPPAQRDKRLADLAEVFLSDRYGKTDAAGRISAAEVLCRVEPFSLQNDMAAQLGRALTHHFDQAMYRVQEDVARTYDCAGSNFSGGYFSFVREESALFNRAACAADPAGPWRLDREGAEALLAKGADLRARMAKASGEYLSYYAIRLDQRLAAVDAAIAIDALAAGDEAKARAHFAAAGKRLTEWRAAGRLERARNGWRQHADIRFGSLFYLAVSGDQSARDTLNASAVNYRPVLQIGKLLPAIGAETREMIERENPDYRDPISIQRILPGATGDLAQDCAAWSRRSFAPREIMSHGAACIDQTLGGGLSEASIRALDACIDAFESRDWWVQTGAYFAEEDAAQEVRRVTTALLSNPLPRDLFVDDLMTIAPPDRQSGLYRVRTRGDLTRDQAAAVQAAVERLGLAKDPVLGRKRQY